MAAAEEVRNITAMCGQFWPRIAFAVMGPIVRRGSGIAAGQREVAIQVGAIEPGKPDSSEMVRRIFSSDADEMMPPPAAHKTIDGGAKKKR